MRTVIHITSGIYCNFYSQVENTINGVANILKQTGCADILSTSMVELHYFTEQ